MALVSTHWETCWKIRSMTSWTRISSEGIYCCKDANNRYIFTGLWPAYPSWMVFRSLTNRSDDIIRKLWHLFDIFPSEMWQRADPMQEISEHINIICLLSWHKHVHPSIWIEPMQVGIHFLHLLTITERLTANQVLKMFVLTYTCHVFECTNQRALWANSLIHALVLK